jgi:hypothetical protein
MPAAWTWLSLMWFEDDDELRATQRLDIDALSWDNASTSSVLRLVRSSEGGEGLDVDSASASSSSA